MFPRLQASSGDYILWNTLGKCPTAALPRELWLSAVFSIVPSYFGVDPFIVQTSHSLFSSSYQTCAGNFLVLAILDFFPLKEKGNKPAAEQIFLFAVPWRYTTSKPWRYEQWDIKSFAVNDLSVDCCFDCGSGHQQREMQITCCCCNAL